MNKNKLYIAFVVSVILAGCTAGGNDTGLEYAPQMYHSVPYEPLSILDNEGISEGFLEQSYYQTNYIPIGNESGKGKINMLNPVQGTVKRQNYSTVTETNTSEPGKSILVYDLHKDSLELASRILANPLPETDEITSRGKHLYLGFCAPCHGENGNGKGKVGEVYKGVPNYSQGRYATMTEGHIFHTITHGKGRMWAHKSQLNPEERWMVVRYVQTLQKG